MAVCSCTASHGVPVLISHVSCLEGNQNIENKSQCDDSAVVHFVYVTRYLDRNTKMCSVVPIDCCVCGNGQLTSGIL